MDNFHGFEADAGNTFEKIDEVGAVVVFGHAPAKNKYHGLPAFQYLITNATIIMKKTLISSLLVLFACASHAQAPQKTGVLREPVQIPLVMNGKQVGMSTVAAGTKVQVVSEADGKVQIAVSGGQVWVAPEKVDEVQEAPRVVQSPAPKPASAVSAPPKASATENGGDEGPKIKTIEERVAQRMAAFKKVDADRNPYEAEHKLKGDAQMVAEGRCEWTWMHRINEGATGAEIAGAVTVLIINPENLLENREVFLAEYAIEPQWVVAARSLIDSDRAKCWNIYATRNWPSPYGRFFDNDGIAHQQPELVENCNRLNRRPDCMMFPIDPVFATEGYDDIFNIFVFMAPTFKDADQIVRLAREGATVIINNSAPGKDGLPFEIPAGSNHPVKKMLAKQTEKKQVKFERNGNVVCFTGLAGLTDKQWEDTLADMNQNKPVRNKNVCAVVDGLINEIISKHKFLHPLPGIYAPDSAEWTRLFLERKR